MYVGLGGDLLVDVGDDLGGSGGRGNDNEKDLARLTVSGRGEVRRRDYLPGTAWLEEC